MSGRHLASGAGSASVTRDCELVPTEDGEPSWLDTRGWDDTEGVEDSVSFRKVLEFINDNAQNKVRAVIWTILPSERATGTLRRQAAFIDEFANGQVWDRVVIVCKQPPGGDLERACQGALRAARDHSGTDCSGVKLWGCDIMRLPLGPDPHPLAGIGRDTRLRNRVLTKEEALQELEEVIRGMKEPIRVVFRDASCSACGVTSDRRLLPDYCHLEPEQTHPGRTEPFHPQTLVPYHPGAVEKRHTEDRTGPHERNPKRGAIGGWLGRKTNPDYAFYYPCCGIEHRSYESPPPPCKDVHACCQRASGAEGCLKRFDCCRSAEGVAGCGRKYVCCEALEGAVGCQTMCRLCGGEWGTPAGECYRRPHRLNEVE